MYRDIFEWFNPINLFINNLDSFDDGQKRKKKNRKITKDTKGKGTQSNERLRTKRQVKTKEFKGRRQRSLKKGDKGRQKRTTTDGKEGRQRKTKLELDYGTEWVLQTTTISNCKFHYISYILFSNHYSFLYKLFLIQYTMHLKKPCIFENGNCNFEWRANQNFSGF